ncbi:hypothetical protein U9M48_004162 [Paspalum notatum var. saurae]|uniref:Uncharacterized protein n=1 Tax=Paspalum notatum var. saurae TaxID=547442 RepID=A0AAQ3PN60_PASNO
MAPLAPPGRVSVRRPHLGRAGMARVATGRGSARHGRGRARPRRGQGVSEALEEIESQRRRAEGGAPSRMGSGNGGGVSAAAKNGLPVVVPAAAGTSLARRQLLPVLIPTSRAYPAPPRRRAIPAVAVPLHLSGWYWRAAAPELARRMMTAPAVSTSPFPN